MTWSAPEPDVATNPDYAFEYRIYLVWPGDEDYPSYYQLFGNIVLQLQYDGTPPAGYLESKVEEIRSLFDNTDIEVHVSRSTLVTQAML
jgi:hypothetical protein